MGSADGGVNSGDSGRRRLILYVYRSDLAIWTNYSIGTSENRGTEPATVCLEAFNYRKHLHKTKEHTPYEAISVRTPVTVFKSAACQVQILCGVLEHVVGM